METTTVVWNLLEVNNKITRTTSMLNLNEFETFLYSFRSDFKQENISLVELLRD